MLSSIPLCSRAKELQDVPELDLRPEEKPESAVTVNQPQPVSQVNVNLIRPVPREVVNQLSSSGPGPGPGQVQVR